MGLNIGLTAIREKRCGLLLLITHILLERSLVSIGITVVDDGCGRTTASRGETICDTLTPVEL